MRLEEQAVDAVPESEAARLARKLYGLDAEARALPGEYDASFHLTVPDGPGFVLRDRALLLGGPARSGSRTGVGGSNAGVGEF